MADCIPGNLLLYLSYRQHMETGELPPGAQGPERPESVGVLEARALAPDTARERRLRETIVHDSHIPVESLKNPTVNLFVDVAAAVNRINSAFVAVSPEAEYPGANTRTSLGTPGQEALYGGWAARFASWQATVAEDQWLRGGLSGQTESSKDQSSQVRRFLLPSAHFAGLFLGPAEPTAPYATPEPGLWRDPAARGAMYLAGEASTKTDSPENQPDYIDKGYAWDAIVAEASRAGLDEAIPQAEQGVANNLLVLARRRALMEATAPEVVDNLPPAPGLTPTVQERLTVIHQVNRVAVAALENMMFGKKPPSEELAQGLGDALRPLGIAVFAEEKQPALPPAAH